jgi:hypothetical protein
MNKGQHRAGRWRFAVSSNLSAIHDRIGELLRQEAPEGWQKLVASVEYAAGYERISATARMPEQEEAIILDVDFDDLEAAFRALHHASVHPEGRSWSSARLTFRPGQASEVELTYPEEGHLSVPFAA